MLIFPSPDLELLSLIWDIGQHYYSILQTCNWGLDETRFSQGHIVIELGMEPRSPDCQSYALATRLSCPQFSLQCLLCCQFPAYTNVSPVTSFLLHYPFACHLVFPPATFPMELPPIMAWSSPYHFLSFSPFSSWVSLVPSGPVSLTPWQFLLARKEQYWPPNILHFLPYWARLRDTEKAQSWQRKQ